jgi:predicted transcriptional regulator
MTITLDPELEARLREEAEEEGLTVSAYVEHLLTRREKARAQIEAWATEGRNSGPPIEVGPEYWEGKKRLLLERMERNSRR